MAKEKIRLLFVCTAGEYRSRTAKYLFSKEYNTRNAGVEAMDNQNQLSKEDLEWADVVFVMEEWHRRWISQHFPKQYMMKKILCLDIPDIYKYNQPELIEILKSKKKIINREIQRG